MYYIQVGNLIKTLRKEHKMTMVNFSKLIGVSQPTLSRLESGSQEVTLSLLMNICNVFNITMSEFLKTIEGKNNSYKIEISNENVTSEDELNIILSDMLSSLNYEQKKGLYTLLLPYIK